MDLSPVGESCGVDAGGVQPQLSGQLSHQELYKLTVVIAGHSLLAGGGGVAAAAGGVALVLPPHLHSSPHLYTALPLTQSSIV